MGKLTGKTAIVTGASKGIGAGIARWFAAEGAAVVVNYTSGRTDAEAVVASITDGGGRAIAICADITQQADAAALVATAVDAFGTLDILVNNAGAYQFEPIGAFTEALYERLFDVNVRGLLLVTQAALQVMDKGASIINVGSFITRTLLPESVIYTASKGAVAAITGVLARELGPRGIRVNSVDPGITRTQGTREAGIQGSAMEDFFINQTPLGRLGDVSDIAPVAAFLASDDARWVTGESIVASGGMR